MITTGDAARAIGVTRETLNAWTRAGKVTPHNRTMGGHMRWDVADLLRQLDRTKESPVPETATAPEKQPVVSAIVTSPLGVLAGRRNDGKPPWTFISGEIEPGESQADAAVREVKEETGLEVRAGEREIGRRVHPKTGRTMIYLPCEPTQGTSVYVGDPDELAEVRWLPLPELEDVMSAYGIFDPVHEYLRSRLG